MNSDKLEGPQCSTLWRGGVSPLFFFEAPTTCQQDLPASSPKLPRDGRRTTHSIPRQPDRRSNKAQQLKRRRRRTLAIARVPPRKQTIRREIRRRADVRDRRRRLLHRAGIFGKDRVTVVVRPNKAEGRVVEVVEIECSWDWLKVGDHEVVPIRRERRCSVCASTR